MPGDMAIRIEGLVELKHLVERFEQAAASLAAPQSIWRDVKRRLWNRALSERLGTKGRPDEGERLARANALEEACQEISNAEMLFSYTSQATLGRPAPELLQEKAQHARRIAEGFRIDSQPEMMEQWLARANALEEAVMELARQPDYSRASSCSNAEPCIAGWCQASELRRDESLRQIETVDRLAAAALRAMPALRELLLQIDPAEVVETAIDLKDWKRIELLCGIEPGEQEAARGCG